MSFLDCNKIQYIKIFLVLIVKNLAENITSDILTINQKEWFYLKVKKKSQTVFKPCENN